MCQNMAADESVYYFSYVGLCGANHHTAGASSRDHYWPGRGILDLFQIKATALKLRPCAIFTAVYCVLAAALVV